MDAEEFEGIERVADGEFVRLELVRGEMRTTARADGDRSEAVAWLIRTFVRLRPEYSLYSGYGLKAEVDHRGRLRPDAVLAPAGSFAGHGEWADPAAVLMVVEVTSCEQARDRRTREEKPLVYAETAIPLCLVIDRDGRETVVHGRPENGVYTTVVRHPFGTRVRLPAPVDLTFDSDRLLSLGR
ncbi:hypothetical protein B4N89_31075 [Embleya scabrispora]|uniref:Putative restriction endonuclease domain-containing protein n=1 Tax=Embleya scabrispora TaxID=159449 RepID=A0A1T3NPG1_9ACTN|nr:Uma2 family endonuclease [Embleya scabrispora]OPC78622.1 hypothetical protein B4N89_31075 [Embleya scabrispora]